MSDTSAITPVAASVRPFVRFTPARIAAVILATALVAMAVGAYLLYSAEEASIARLRQNVATLDGQLAQSRQETTARQADLDTTRGQLTAVEADLATALGSVSSLTTDLSTAKQKAEADAKTAASSISALQAEKADLSGKLTTAQSQTKAIETQNAALQAKVTKALARAQLLAEYNAFELAFDQTGNAAEWQKAYTAWFRKLVSLNDPTIGEYVKKMDDDWGASAEANRKVWEVFMSKTFAYLSASVVADLRWGSS